MTKKGRPQSLKSVEQFEKCYFPNSSREERLKSSSASRYGAILARESAGHLNRLKDKQ